MEGKVSLGAALAALYGAKGLEMSGAEASAWENLAALYISHALLNIPLPVLREAQSEMKENSSPLQIGCKEYDTLLEMMTGKADATALEMVVPNSSGMMKNVYVERSLLFEALDWCRDGIG